MLSVVLLAGLYSSRNDFLQPMNKIPATKKQIAALGNSLNIFIIQFFKVIDLDLEA